MIASGLCSYRSLFVRVTCWPYMADQPPSVTTELTLLSRVAYRDREINGPRLRGLLALLAGDLRTGCSAARLMEGLWPDEQPENPAKALQILVSRARAQLGSDVIASTPTGYRLSLREDQVDTSAVLLSASASVRCSRAGDHAAALAHAEEGLALWEGDAGGDAAFDDPVSALREERGSTYRSLVRARALALSRLGRHAEATEALADLVGERPRDEELLLELLRSEAATVGPSAALARYESYRRSLRDELGTDPGPALQALHQQLLQGTSPVVRHGVPHEPNPLLGRDDDIAAVANLLRTSRVTSIVGAGGLGKTRLAQVVSRRAEQRIVHLVALAGVTTDDDVVNEVASVLGAGEVRRTPASQLAIPTDVLTGIAGALGPGPALLVLDNCEHVIRGVAELVRALVSMTQDLRVLTTSRAPLGLSSESVYPLPELDLPTAVELFEQRSRAARPGADLPADLVEEVCRHLDGLPLAVELAAARVRVMSVAEIARRLQDRFALLRGGARDAPERHQTLHAVVDWSWNLLEPVEQAAMRALSVFPGGFTTDAAGRPLRDSATSDVSRVLEHLVNQSLLQVVDTPTGTRFRMLETVREFSTAHREAAGETDQVVGGFLSWARDFGVAHHESPFGADPYSPVERIRAEQDNLVQALRFGLAHADGGIVAATFAVLAGLWIIESSYARLATVAEETARVLSHFRAGPDFVEVTRTALTLCTAFTFLLQGPRAVRSLVALRRLPPAPPNTLARATAIVLGAVPEDRSALQELCDSDEPLVAGAANGIASYLWESQSDPDGALKSAERMLQAFENRGVPWMWALAHCRIAELCLQVEQGAEAQRHLRAALPVLEKLGVWTDVVGLRLWRRAVDLLANAQAPIFDIDLDPDQEPWVLEARAVAVVAHAQHGRLDLVEETTGELPQRLSTMLTNPVAPPPTYFMESPLCGALLLALAMVDVERGERTGDERASRSGARMIALAERFRFLRGFQPTMSSARARQAAEQADRSAYDDAVSSYADLDREDLRAAALTALRAREQS